MAYANEDRFSGFAYDETEIKAILKAERQNSIGFDYDNTLNAEREQALNYYKGHMPDLPALENRSKVVSTDVADAIETLLPDIVDIFLAGEDGITFMAQGAEDEEAAKQETDYVRHVIFQQNRGFKLLYDGFKDAMQLKTGVWKFYWDSEPEYQEYETTVDEMGLQELEQLGVEITGIEPVQGNGGNEPAELFKVTARKMIRNGCVRIEVIPPEDFTVSEETVELSDTSYCAYRRRCRVQDLIADGYDPDELEVLGVDDSDTTSTVRRARDQSNETLDDDDSFSTEMLRRVEVIEHYIRLDLEGIGKPQIWRIVTGTDESCILDIEKRSRIEFASITPYPQPHRFYGQSVADKTIQSQRWVTSLVRMMNDAGHFALNQRQAVNMNFATEDTLPALIDNTPGRPVPTKGDALSPIASGGPGFDVLSAIEYAKTDTEMKTGIVRNAQGLNPDTLHDTKGGAEMLANASQKRNRLMARQFAETGVRDLFLGVHDLLRSNATIADTVKLRNKWVDIQPNAWSRRKDVTIEIGIGSGGKDERAQKLLAYSDRLSGVIEMQGGMGGPLVTAENVYQLNTEITDALGIKNGERFMTNPQEAPPQEPQPDPEMLKLQAEQQAAEAKLAMQKAESDHKMALAREEAAFKAEMRQMELAAEQNAMRERAALEAQLARDKAAAELELAREKMRNELILARERQAFEAEIGAFKAKADAENQANMTANRPGGSLAE
ncbi:hypothetical protein UFOVP399_48 [uncultured Caudovirales phage]|uniref:Uncharacterized protein n=1 Tax=uncultured Caudovirales phage TaxID=2100421 RepID=A0A6J5M2J6_9CAUD|nr:hypothetical protein UFOVP399_48 [uncultured Caudovirales phage]